MSSDDDRMRVVLIRPATWQVVDAALDNQIASLSQSAADPVLLEVSQQARQLAWDQGSLPDGDGVDARHSDVELALPARCWDAAVAAVDQEVAVWSSGNDPEELSLVSAVRSDLERALAGGRSPSD